MAINVQALPVIRQPPLRREPGTLPSLKLPPLYSKIPILNVHRCTSASVIRRPILGGGGRRPRRECTLLNPVTLPRRKIYKIHFKG